MRPIKFRIWDKHYTDPITKRVGGFLPYPCLINHLTFETFEAFDRTFNIEEEKLIIQQYTGLKDKNGKEIFEGDVLIRPAETLNWGEGPFEHGGHPCAVVWKEGVYIWNYDILNMRLAMDLTVIGNIMENGELLK